jgi:BlaI family penicillinase repressor
MAVAMPIPPGQGPRRSILDLAPLELHCMNALWLLREGTVREIQNEMAPAWPRAYTTIMTIMDRLARKGIVTRFKQGRAYLYRPNLSAEEARGHAIEQVVEGFFDGSREALAAHLSGARELPRRTGPHVVAPPLPRAAQPAARPEREKTPEPATELVEQAQEGPAAPAPKLDPTLL